MEILAGILCLLLYNGKQNFQKREIFSANLEEHNPAHLSNYMCIMKDNNICAIQHTFFSNNNSKYAPALERVTPGTRGGREMKKEEVNIMHAVLIVMCRLACHSTNKSAITTMQVLCFVMCYHPCITKQEL